MAPNCSSVMTRRENHKYGAPMRLNKSRYASSGGGSSRTSESCAPGRSGKRAARSRICKYVATFAILPGGSSVYPSASGIPVLAGLPFTHAPVAHHERFAAVDVGVEIRVQAFGGVPIDGRLLARGAARLLVRELRILRERIERFREVLCIGHACLASAFSRGFPLGMEEVAVWLCPTS